MAGRRRFDRAGWLRVADACSWTPWLPPGPTPRRTAAQRDGDEAGEAQRQYHAKSDETAKHEKGSVPTCKAMRSSMLATARAGRMRKKSAVEACGNGQTVDTR